MVLDISQLINPNFAIFFCPRREYALAEVSRRADAFVGKNLLRIRSLLKSDRVFGLMVFMETLTVVGESGQLGSATRWTISNLCRITDPRAEFLRTLAVRLGGRYLVRQENGLFLELCG